MERIRSASCPEKSAHTYFRQNHDDSRFAILKAACPRGDTSPVSDSAMTWWGFQSRSHKPLYINKFREIREALSATLPSRRRTTPHHFSSARLRKLLHCHKEHIPQHPSACTSARAAVTFPNKNGPRFDRESSCAASCLCFLTKREYPFGVYCARGENSQ